MSKFLTRVGGILPQLFGLSHWPLASSTYRISRKGPLFGGRNRDGAGMSPGCVRFECAATSSPPHPSSGPLFKGPTEVGLFFFSDPAWGPRGLVGWGAVGCAAGEAGTQLITTFQLILLC